MANTYRGIGKHARIVKHTKVTSVLPPVIQEVQEEIKPKKRNKYLIPLLVGAAILLVLGTYLYFR